VNQHIEELRAQLENDLKAVTALRELEAVKVRYLGRKGPIQELMKLLRDVPSEERPQAGKAINDLKQFMEDRISALEGALAANEDHHQIARETIDVTLPGRCRFLGRSHPLTQMLDEVLNILIEMGFTVQYGPEIETDYYNFEALNFAKDHPARDMQDTFYVASEVLLRTHTSNTQVRVMEQYQPPIRVAAPGCVYRNEDVTVRSHVFFHQVEGFYIDEKVSFADLFQTLRDFLNKLFQREIKVRFRPSYFPFVEPGVEVDVACTVCEGKGCALCKHTGWLEILGAGMIHPEVLKSGGIDPEKYSGYAWGMGIERLLMLRRGIKDIRLFTENDIRFLEQF
jgi:phenylalanyl-tRNA synthetase alpha chain